MLWKPWISCFIPSHAVLRPLTSIEYQQDRLHDDIEHQKYDETEDRSPTDKAWGRTKMIKSDGNYLGESFLEVGPLYANQDKLKCLPIPSLQDTVKRFLPTALPLVESEEEAKSLQRAADAFQSQAQVLQDRLEDRKQKREKRTSWLQEYWQSEIYLKWRAPLNFYSSYYFLLNDPDQAPPFWESSANAGIVKAAALCRAATKYADKVTSGLKDPDVAGKKKSPLCSTGYKYLFNACRIPKIDQDSYKIFNPRMHKHAIAACRGHFFEIPLVDFHGKPLNHPELEDLLYQCEEKSISRPRTLELGWLTTWDRDEWATARKVLKERGAKKMEKALERLESALLLLNLDIETSTESVHEQAVNFWHGSETEGMNRWWDKSVQLCVTRNGKWAYLGEHSMLDGLLPVEFCEYLLDNATYDPHQRIPEDQETSVVGELKPVDVFEEAIAELSDAEFQEIKEYVDRAKADFMKLKDDLSMNVLEFDSYGIDLIKGTGASSDAYAQMAIQLAAYRLFGKLVGTYESTQVRQFRHGRTETARSVSPAAAVFCEAMGGETKIDRSPEERAELLKLLQQAAFSHAWYSKKATMGMGVDRHFFGLAKMAKDDDEIPDLFKHPVYERSKTWRLSTSTLPTCPGFGMVVDDGLGIGYGVYDKTMLFNIAARTETQYSARFKELLEEVLQEMKTLRPDLK